MKCIDVFAVDRCQVALEIIERRGVMQYIRPGFLTLAYTASLLLWASVAVTPASAGQVTFQFTGSVTDVGVGTPTAYSIHSGSVLNGSYLMDPQDPNIIRTEIPAGHATYDAVGVKNLTFTLGDLVASPPSQEYTKAGSVVVSSSSSAGGGSHTSHQHLLIPPKLRAWRSDTSAAADTSTTTSTCQ